jgi:hypothetical protein
MFEPVTSSATEVTRSRLPPTQVASLNADAGCTIEWTLNRPRVYPAGQPYRRLVEDPGSEESRCPPEADAVHRLVDLRTAGSARLLLEAVERAVIVTRVNVPSVCPLRVTKCRFPDDHVTEDL